MTSGCNLYVVNGRLVVIEPPTTIRCEFPECFHEARNRENMDDHLAAEHLLFDEEDPPTYMAEPDEEGVYHVSSLEDWDE